jgi:tripeptidyl-peptidase-1
MLTMTRYHLPSHIQEHVDYVTPGIKLIITSKVASLKKRSSIPGKSKGVTPLGAPVGDWPAPSDPESLATCDVLITPACIKALYQIPPAPIFPNPTNAMGIYEEGDAYDQEDLDLFFQKYTQYIPQGTHPTPNFIDGGEAPVPVADGGGESTLDMELTYPIIFPQKIILYQTDDYDYALEYPVEGFGNEFLDALDGVCPSFSNFGGYQLIKSSPTARIQHMARLEMTQF